MTEAESLTVPQMMKRSWYLVMSAYFALLPAGNSSHEVCRAMLPSLWHRPEASSWFPEYFFALQRQEHIWEVRMSLPGTKLLSSTGKKKQQKNIWFKKGAYCSGGLKFYQIPVWLEKLSNTSCVRRKALRNKSSSISTKGSNRGCRLFCPASQVPQVCDKAGCLWQWILQPCIR